MSADHPSVVAGERPRCAGDCDKTRGGIGGESAAGGTVAEGKPADLLIADGDPLQEPQLLTDSGRIWLVLQLGVPVAGQALERDIGVETGEPTIM
jgi:hypothetical protein